MCMYQYQQTNIHASTLTTRFHTYSPICRYQHASPYQHARRICTHWHAHYNKHPKNTCLTCMQQHACILWEANMHYYKHIYGMRQKHTSNRAQLTTYTSKYARNNPNEFTCSHTNMHIHTCTQHANMLQPS